MPLTNIRNFYVVYGIMYGGRHLTQLLKMCPEFRAHPQSDDYIKTIVDLYINRRPTWESNTPVAHVYDNPLLSHAYQVTTKADILSSNHVNLWHGHFNSYQAALEQHMIEDWGPYYGIIITDPKNSKSLISKRLNDFNTLEGKDRPPYKLPYHVEYANQHFHLDDTNALEIDSDIFFTEDGCNYVANLIRTRYELVLPPEAQIIHNIWIARLKFRYLY